MLCLVFQIVCSRIWNKSLINWTDQSYINYGVYINASSIAVRALPYVPMVWDTLQSKGWTLVHYPSSNKWGSGGNPGEVRQWGKEIPILPHKTDGPRQVSSLTDTPQHTDCIWNLSLPLNLKKFQILWLFTGYYLSRHCIKA